MEKYITATKAAQILGISRMAVNNRIRAGKIPAIVVDTGGVRPRYFISENTVLELVKGE